MQALLCDAVPFLLSEALKQATSSDIGWIIGHQVMNGFSWRSTYLMFIMFRASRMTPNFMSRSNLESVAKLGALLTWLK